MKRKKVKKFVIVDIETTGLAPAENEVIEIGAVRLVYDGKSFKEDSQYHQLIKPYKDIPHNIQNLTKITPKTVAKAPRFEEVYPEFLEFLGDAVFVAHNVQFDLQMMDVNLKRVGGPEIQNPTIDSQQLVAIAFPMLSSQKLGDVAKYLKIKRNRGHRALDDAQVTAEVFLQFVHEIYKLNPAVLIEINNLLRSHSWPLKEVFIKAQEKVLAKYSPSEISNLRGWKEIAKNVLKFKKLKRSKAKDQDWQNLISEEVEEMIAEEGVLAKQFSNYEYRKPQLEMLKLIIDAFNNNQNLMIEAGTGTGKTIAYLLPAIHWAIKNGTPVVISTRTKNLQAQLMDKDIPLLKKVIGNEFNALLLKGRENYVCLRRVELLLKRMLLAGTLEQVLNVLPVLIWLSQTKTGDLSELHLSIYRLFLRHIKSETASCTGDKCSLHNKCFLQNIRQQARRADVLIINHSLLFTDISGDGLLLPEYKHLIIDEGHTIEDAATEGFSMKISAGDILEQLKRLQLLAEEDVQELVVSLREKTFALFETIYKFAAIKRKIAYREEIKLIVNAEVSSKEEWQEIIESFYSWQKAHKSLDKVIKLQKEGEAKATEIQSCQQNLISINDKLNFIFDQKDKNFVRWIMVNKAMIPYNCFLNAAPIEVGKYLQEYLFAAKDSVIVTSATLAIGDKFDYFLKRFGFANNEAISTYSLGSSFNYEEQLLFCVPNDFPGAEDEKFSRKVFELFIPLFEITKGRALVLFTSYKMLQKVYNKVRIELEKKGLNILCQGKHGSRRAILNRFRENPHSILFGTDSFWSGVDIPGKELSCVVMMKLPFAVPTDPIISARLERYAKDGKDGFFSYSVPQAIMKFRQGLGRLIRTKEDKGVVILLDGRVLKKNYGKVFLKSIPGREPLLIGVEDVLKETEKWLN